MDHDTVVEALVSRDAIVAAARALYRTAPARARLLQSLRPYICPFEDLLRWLPDTGRLLDVGCGAGLFVGLAGYSRPAIRAIGFDAEPGAVAAAQAMARAHFPDGRIAFRHSAVGDRWPEGPFDAVSMIDVLHHIPPDAQYGAVIQCFEHVAPGGTLLYKDMASRPLVPAWWNRLHDLILARQWIHYRAIDEVEEWLAVYGAKIVDRGSRRLGLYAHEYIVATKPA
jgi:2-polyprenyl-3-methyl-5-hydroxy-6-metoxy-1,4-benzoquinol methylase